MTNAIFAAALCFALKAVAADSKPMMQPTTTQAPTTGTMQPSTGAPATGTMAPAAKPMMAEKTCGQWMSEKAELPSKMGELMGAVAEGTEAHAKWVGTSKDKAARAESAMMMKMAKDQRTMATMSTKMAEQMMKAKDMASVPHDMSKMDPKVTEIMTRMAKLDREMAALLMKDAEQIEARLTQMSQMKTTAGGMK